MRWLVLLSVLIFSDVTQAKGIPDESYQYFQIMDALKQFRAQISKEDSSCPSGYAFRIEPGFPFAGSYLRCEDEARFSELIDKGQNREAKKLLLNRDE